MPVRALFVVNKGSDGRNGGWRRRSRLKDALSEEPPESVPRLVDEWLEWWHERHRALQGQPKEDVLVGPAELHHRFLKIHPFMDANGRVVRSITDQAARELLNEGIGAEFIADTHAYYAALAAADCRDLKPPFKIGLKLPFSEPGFAHLSIHL